jgi:uncharacterized ion transporter superfamily protein YfcC
MKISRLTVPHTLVLLFAMIVLAYVATLLLPAGSFERVENEHGREQVVPGTFRALPAEEAPELPPTAIFTAIPEGLGAAQEIIFFVFLIGGAFGLLRATGAPDAAIGRLLARFSHRPLPLVIGAWRCSPSARRRSAWPRSTSPSCPCWWRSSSPRLRRVTAVGVLCVGYAVGYGAALINPFTVFIAQEVAGVEQASGLGFRSDPARRVLRARGASTSGATRGGSQRPGRSLVADVPLPEAG